MSICLIEIYLRQIRKTNMNLDKFIESSIETKEIDFRGNTLTLTELTYGEVEAFSIMAKELEDLDALESNRKAAGTMLRAGIKEFAELTEEQLAKFSPVAIRDLNSAVMEFNGLSATEVDESVEGKPSED
jgi:hypothetical protein